MRGSGLPSSAYASNEVAPVARALTAMDASATPATNLTVDDVRRLLTVATDERNLRARFGALSRFLDWAQDAGHISANPCALIGRARRPKAPQASAHYPDAC
jgi:hypothetical protein